MLNRSLRLFFTATIIFSWTAILLKSKPAGAHSVDYCIDILQEEAEIAATGTSKRQLKQNLKDYKEYEKICDAELREAGFITLQQVRKGKDVANLVRSGKIVQDDLDPQKQKQDKEDVSQREAKLESLRSEICANPTEETAYACPKGKEVEASPQSSLRRANDILIAAASGVKTDQLLAQSADPALVGQWSGPFTWPLVPIHVSVGPNGKVLAWQRPKLAPSGPQSVVWTPASNTFTSVPSISTDIFCAGQAFAPSGRLLIAGGHEGSTAQDPNQVAGIGADDTNVFDFATNRWFEYPANMNKGRWYPTLIYLGTGEGLVFSGSNTQTSDVNLVPQVWGTNDSPSWRSLSAAPFTPTLYPWMFVAPNGKVFMAGHLQTSRYLDTTTGAWTTVGNNNFGPRHYGTSVMYDNGKVLIVGGSITPYGTPTKTAEVIDLNGATPRWLPVGSMANARRHVNATVLPNGQVFVSGGTSSGSFNDATGKVLTPEMWNPDSTNWSPMASMQVPRLYHGTAVLLPDGRVLSAGGGLPLGDNEVAPGTGSKTQGHYDGELYSPPYLFKGARPTVSSAPTSIGYGQQFTVGTPDAANITKVSLIRLSSDTHSFNGNQRFNKPSFVQASGGLNIMAPSSKNLTPPGHYMLFILNSQGVPSVANIIKIG